MRVMFAGNYLRVRGEYSEETLIDAAKRELPPRARRIPGITPKHNPSTGTTSACAENTWVSWVPGRLSWNYLRVRGEYIVLFTIKTPHGELPPRARRIRRKY